MGPQAFFNALNKMCKAIISEKKGSGNSSQAQNSLFIYHYPQNINSVLHVPYKNNKKGLFPAYRVKLFFISGFLFHTPML